MRMQRPPIPVIYNADIAQKLRPKKTFRRPIKDNNINSRLGSDGTTKMSPRRSRFETCNAWSGDVQTFAEFGEKGP